MSNHQQSTERKPLPTLAYPLEDQRRLQNQELRAITRRTPVEKIRDGMGERLVPVGEPPLTSWKTYPTDKKFPVIPAKKRAFHFTRKRIGENLFPPPNERDHPFDARDPYIRETPMEYESMHDPHLKDYYENNPEIRERLACDGLMLWPGGGVKASMKDWNKYRGYLGRLQNPTLDKNFTREAELKKLELDQLRNIKVGDKRELRKKIDEKRKEFMEALRKERKAREIYAQLKSETAARSRLCEKEKAIELSIAKREVLRQKVRERLAKLKKAETKRARRIIVGWYCKQLYADVMKKAIAGHKKAQRNADRDNFVGTKRKFQKQKKKYLSFLEDRREAEQECLVRKRIKKYEVLWTKHEDPNIDRRTKEQRDLDLVRKYAMRWLNFVRAQMQQRAMTYQDSVWRVRKQLIEMVKRLKKETGQVSFTSFIKSLVQLKPGREKLPEMTDEVRETMNYILDVLIKAAFDTYRKHHHPCANAYEKQSNRRRILGQPDHDPEDTEYPELMTKPRVKPEVPFDFPEFDCAREIEKAAEAAKSKAFGESRRCACKRHLGIKSPCGRRLKKGGECDSTDSSCIAERISRAALQKASRQVCAKGPEGESCRRSKRVKTHFRSRDRDSENSSDIAERISRMVIQKASEGMCAEGPEGDSCRQSLRDSKGGRSDNSSDIAEHLSIAVIKKASRKICEEGPEGEECRRSLREEAARKAGGDGGSENSSEAAERLSRSALQKVTHVAFEEGSGGSKRSGKGADSKGRGAAGSKQRKTKGAGSSSPETKGPRKKVKGTKGDDGKSENSGDIAEHLSKTAIKNASRQICAEGPEGDECRKSLLEEAARRSEETPASRGGEGASKKPGDAAEKSPGSRVESTGTGGLGTRSGGFGVAGDGSTFSGTKDAGASPLEKNDAGSSPSSVPGAKDAGSSSPGKNDAGSSPSSVPGAKDAGSSSPGKNDAGSSPTSLPGTKADESKGPTSGVDSGTADPTTAGDGYSPPPGSSAGTQDSASSPPETTMDDASTSPGTNDTVSSPLETKDAGSSSSGPMDTTASSPLETMDAASSHSGAGVLGTIADGTKDPASGDDSGIAGPTTASDDSNSPGTKDDSSSLPGTKGDDESSASSAVANKLSAEALKRVLDNLSDPETKSESSSIIAEKLGKIALRKALERICGIKPDPDESCEHCLPDDGSETSSQLAERLGRIALHYAIEKICGGAEPMTKESCHHCLPDAGTGDTSSETSSTLAEKCSHIAVQKAVNRICTEKLNPAYDGGDVGKLGINQQLVNRGFR